KINLLKQGKVPIYEPNLDELIEKNIKENRLFFSTDSKKSIQKSEIIFICKGTPSQPNGQVNLKYVEDAAIEIGRAINDYKIIVNKSTVPIGSYSSFIVSIAFLLDEPITILSVKNTSYIAEPSLKNSGQETTSKGTFLFNFSCSSFIIIETQSPEPMGTVLLLTIIL
ncbi:unnamed protein product, partial [marine sediment metagenome]